MIDWQITTALLLVAAAAIYLLRRIARLFAGRSTGCGSGSEACGSCPSSGDSKGARSDAELVDLLPEYHVR